ncbi:MAG TPA: type IV secretion system DNA-binding domain-containing protein [Candidatus Saccharimonadales bacterium]|nr:type IV secretion system DNA-binding domain-containing protein [Candidatus Saccharimonadales bacterium]
MDMLSFLFSLLGKWYIWLPIALVLGYLAVRNNRRAKVVQELEHVLLILEIPRTNDKQELAAEQMFASLHGILRSKRELAMQGGLQEHISFEFAAIEKRIRFYVWVPSYLQNFVEGQIYAQYPTVQIFKADNDYAARDISHAVTYTAELGLMDNEVLPIKTFQSFEVDPLAAITATLAKLEEPGEEMWIQVLARPISDEWHRKSSKYTARVKSGAFGMASSNASPGYYIMQALSALAKPPEEAGKSPEISERDKGRISEVEKKSVKLGYQVKVRITYLGHSEQTAKLRMQAIVGTFKQFNSTNLNGFVMKNPSFSVDGVAQYRARFFIDRGYILNIEELASVFHLPHTNVETPSIVWASSKTAEPPAKLPVITGEEADKGISAFGLTNFRGINQQFGMYRSDRGRHVYIIGQTGTGKSGLLELFALSDVFHRQGYAIIDPHGDFAINNLKFVPSSRIKDVVYFNPADTAYPVGFNPMEVIDPNMKNNISSEIIGVLKRMFGESWGPRLEYILRYTILALLDYPNTTLLDIAPMLTDKKFRKKVVENCQDAVVRQFWNVEFASWTEKFAAEAIAPVLNKVGAFTANPIIRNIVGQPKSTFNIRQIMDEGKILVVNLSKGLIGEDNAAILGSFIVTKIQLAAMSRSDIPNVDDRRPFYLYVDEFQNFATDSFATILSEARKYGLNLTVANQYVSQMTDTVRAAVFGNVGTTICFRISPEDSATLAKQFEPTFTPQDIMEMANRHFIISMVIKGEKVPAFSATTLTLPPNQNDFLQQIVEHTRLYFARPRADIEEEIGQLIAPNQSQGQLLQPTAAQQPSNAPKSATQAKQHPIPSSNTPVASKDKTATEPKTPAATPPEPEVVKKLASVITPKPTSEAGEKGKGSEPSPQPQAPHQPAGEGTGKKKRRRRRGGKGKGSGSEGEQSRPQAPQPPTASPTPPVVNPAAQQAAPKSHDLAGGETVIRLR